MILLYGYMFYYVAAALGISAGYHRYFTHRSFKTTPFYEVVMLTLGLICGGRSALTWAAVHRLHHATSDTENDPHSPIYKGRWTVILNRWKVQYIPKKYLVGLINNPRVVFFHRYGIYMHMMYAAATLLISLQCFIILTLVPFILSWIGFGLLNYLAHKDGKPANSILLNFIAPGEGWHKYHHDNPMKYVNHRFDIAGVIIENIIKR